MEQILTKKQEKALEFIYKIIKDSGFPPTLADLKEELGVLSNQSVLNFLEVLERKGCIKREEGQARGIKILPLGFKLLGKNELIPLAGITAAGPYIESFADAFDRWQTLPSRVIETEMVKQSKDDVFIIQVHGDSMINAGIDNGDALLVKKTNQFKSGDIVVARSDEGTTVKRFIAEPDGRAYLKPENPAYKNIPIFEETYFDGKVILNLTKITT